MAIPKARRRQSHAVEGAEEEEPAGDFDPEEMR